MQVPECGRVCTLIASVLVEPSRFDHCTLLRVGSGITAFLFVLFLMSVMGCCLRPEPGLFLYMRWRVVTGCATGCAVQLPGSAACSASPDGLRAKKLRILRVSASILSWTWTGWHLSVCTWVLGTTAGVDSFILSCFVAETSGAVPPAVCHKLARGCGLSTARVQASNPSIVGLQLPQSESIVCGGIRAP